MSNLKTRINKSIASHYGHDTDIPNMPDFAGVWVIDQATYDRWIGIMREDLARELSPAYHAEDRRHDLIAAWRRQIAALEAATLTDEPIAEPVGRAEALAREQARWLAFMNA